MLCRLTYYFTLNLLIGIAGTKYDVWKTISETINSTYGTTITPASVRIRVALNRNGLMEKLGLSIMKKIASNTLAHGKFHHSSKIYFQVLLISNY